MKKAPLLSMATINALGINPFKETTREVKATQLGPIPKSTGNVLYDVILFTRAHLPFTGFRIPKKPVKEKTGSYARTAVQKRALAYA